jgi:hypothetical protein
MLLSLSIFNLKLFMVLLISEHHLVFLKVRNEAVSFSFNSVYNLFNRSFHEFFLLSIVDIVLVLLDDQLRLFSFAIAYNIDDEVLSIYLRSSGIGNLIL